MQQPSLGRVVLAVVNPTMNNGSDVAPATITRVWAENPGGYWVVNYKVTLDSSGADLWVSSARLYADELEAREYVANGSNAAFWPPRV